jgi:glutathione S-transferase
MMAERLGSGPSLLPGRSLDRALALGLSAELCAPDGFGWARRLLIFEKMFRQEDTSPDPPAHVGAILHQYGFSEAPVKAARARIIDILSTLADQLRKQQACGSPYVVGDRPSTIDFYWACFSMMVAPPPLSYAPGMPPSLVETYGDVDPAVAAALDPLLIEHRDFIYRRHIGLPLDV